MIFRHKLYDFTVAHVFCFVLQHLNQIGINTKEIKDV